MINEVDFKNKVARNITKFRKEIGLTQGALAEKLNYSDKSVSKWERGDGLPDIYVIKQMSEIFGVTVGDILGEEPSPTPKEDKDTPKKKAARRAMIVAMSACLVWLSASVIFFLLKLLPFDISKSWGVFIVAIPVSFIVLLVFACIWYGTLFKILSVSALIWTVPIPMLVFGNSGKFAFAFIICGMMQILSVLWFVMSHFFKKPKDIPEETEEKIEN